MKRLSTTVLFLVIIVGSCQQQESSTSKAVRSEQAIKTIIDDFFVALGSNDSTGLTDLLTNDFHMFEHDQRWNADSLRSLMPKTIGRQWEVSELVINQDKELIHVSYFNNSLNPKGRSWFESILLTDSESGLKIKFMHSTKLYLK